jgi:8-amino-7-oxononanoate synthase
MRTILITGSDTGIGKTRVTGSLARLLAKAGSRVRIVKAIETGAPPVGDAEAAAAIAGPGVEHATWLRLEEPLAPAAAVDRAGTAIDLAKLIAHLRGQSGCDWLLVEGAGGVATPIDREGRDWADLAGAVPVDAIVVVVPDRLGAINQGRLAVARARSAETPVGVWLNALEPADARVAGSNREGLLGAGIPIWAESNSGSIEPIDPIAVLQEIREATGTGQGGRAAKVEVAGDRPDWIARGESLLRERDKVLGRRRLQVAHPANFLNLADNDYLGLSRDPLIAEALVKTVRQEGASASASPLITGWRQPHESLLEELCGWHSMPFGLLWSSGFAANAAVLGTLAGPGDLVLADRLVHHSLITGILRSGARLQRHAHLDLDALESLLERTGDRTGSRFVVTESVFSMDGDSPDLERMADLRRRHEFCWVLDEAHALGWYGPGGAGLARSNGVQNEVDVLVGTLGKTLASAGAYTLFSRESVRDHLVNAAGDFIYSTAMPPGNAAAAQAAIRRVRELSGSQEIWHEASRRFREKLRAENWDVSPGDSPIVPVLLKDSDSALGLAALLREAGVLVGAVRPPTVPAETSRLRFSLKRTFGDADAAHVIDILARWRKSR